MCESQAMVKATIEQYNYILHHLDSADTWLRSIKQVGRMSSQGNNINAIPSYPNRPR